MSNSSVIVPLDEQQVGGTTMTTTATENTVEHDSTSQWYSAKRSHVTSVTMKQSHFKLSSGLNSRKMPNPKITSLHR